jgi:hypothetical protein
MSVYNNASKEQIRMLSALDKALYKALLALWLVEKHKKAV